MTPITDILLVEDNLAEAHFFQELLKGSTLHRAKLIHKQRLAEAIAYCHHASVNVVMLDLTLPDSYGLASLDTFIEQVPDLPLVVLTNTHDTDLAVEAVRRGAQDYLFKRQVSGDILVRSLQYALERHQGENALREANETLELRVQQRTAQLEHANQLLVQEIQERRHTQDRLTLAQQAARVGTFESNLSTGKIIWSPELEALYGVPTGTFGDNCATWLQTVYADDRLGVEQALQQAIAHHQPLDIEFRILKHPQKLHWIALKSNVFSDAEDSPLRLVGIHMDITEKKQLEAQFLRAQRLESLGTLASGIAHDLNNILTPMLGVAQLLPLKLPHLDNRTRDLLDTLENSARRGASLIKQILSFAQGIEGERVCLQPAHIVREVLQMMAQTLPKSIQVSKSIDENLWTLSGDVTQLHQVLMNLCVNARDAMPQGGTLYLQAYNTHLEDEQAQRIPEASAGPYVAISVADTGTGIPPEVMPNIFDPFFTTKEVGKGTGLGLSAVLGIVQSHGGFLDVQSQSGKGSQFTVYLPALPAEMLPPETSLTALTGHQETLLVVDDEHAIREVMKATLEAYQYKVLTAENAIAAITLYQERQSEIDAVLIDLMMPGMDGKMMMSILRQLDPAVKAIAISGLSASSTVEHFYEIGFYSLLTKPLTTQELLKTLRCCLENSSHV